MMQKMYPVVVAYLKCLYERYKVETSLFAPARFCKPASPVESSDVKDYNCICKFNVWYTLWSGFRNWWCRRMLRSRYLRWIFLHGFTFLPPPSIHPLPVAPELSYMRVMFQKCILKLLLVQFSHCEVVCLDYISRHMKRVYLFNVTHITEELGYPWLAKGCPWFKSWQGCLYFSLDYHVQISSQDP